RSLKSSCEIFASSIQGGSRGSFPMLGYSRIPSPEGVDSTGSREPRVDAYIITAPEVTNQYIGLHREHPSCLAPPTVHFPGLCRGRARGSSDPVRIVPPGHRNLPLRATASDNSCPNCCSVIRCREVERQEDCIHPALSPAPRRES